MARKFSASEVIDQIIADSDSEDEYLPSEDDSWPSDSESDEDENTRTVLLVMFTFGIELGLISPTLNPQQVGMARTVEVEVVSLDK